MTIDIIQNRLQTYAIKTKQEEINAIKEMSQEVALAGLARAGFFKHGQFQGGTCLRIIHGLQRFSEALDFILNQPDEDFKWETYLSDIETEFDAFGLSLSTIDRSKASDAVKKAFLKETSFGKVLNLSYERTRSDIQTINIKLEIDTNPPEGSITSPHVLDFPYPFPIIAQDLPSLFAGKCHALLCRPYTKGRDWFDLIWYIQNKVQPNTTFLANALMQYGPYQDQPIAMSTDWLINALSEKIQSLDWKAVTNDVKSFLPQDSLHQVSGWDTNLFLALVKQLR